MYWHIDADIISLIVIAAVYVYYIRVEPEYRSDEKSRRFVWCLIAGIVTALIDIAASLIMDFPVNRVLYQLLMVLYFAVIEYVNVVWFLYSMAIFYPDDEKGRKVSGLIVIVPYTVYALLVVSNPISGLFFTLGPNCQYQRGPLFPLMVVLHVLHAIALFSLTLIRRRHIADGYSAGVLLLMPLIVAASIAVQLLVPGWLVIVPGYMLSVVIAFLFLQMKNIRESRTVMKTLSVAAMTDQLTGLFNRAGMEQIVSRHCAESAGKRCLTAAFDLDDLKSINDTMGHPEGDRAICALASQIKLHFRSTDAVARYGGDEFIAYLLIGEMTEAQARRNIEELLDEISLLRIGEHDEASINVSIGAVIGVVGRDSLETLCSRADTALYHVKQHGKSSYAFYEPSMESTVFEKQ